MRYAKEVVGRTAKAFVAAGISALGTWLSSDGFSNDGRTSSVVKAGVAALLAYIVTYLVPNKKVVDKELELAGE